MIYRLLIVLATLIWGSSFVMVKDVTDYLDPSLILLVRFAVAAVVLALVFAPKKRHLYFQRSYVLIGLMFGVALFFAYYVQTWGVVFTTPGKNAFLTGTYCVMVPFLAWAVSRKRPTAFNLGAAVLCIAGIGLVSLGDVDGFNIGDGLTLLCAFFYAVHIVLVFKFSEGRDIFVLTMWQFAGVALCSVVAMVVVGASPAAFGVLDAGQWGQLAYLALCCTTLALLFQNIGQANIPPASASLLLSLESPFGVAFSVALGAEVLQPKTLLGFVLIFAAILISEVLPDVMAKRREPSEGSAEG